MKIIGRKIIGNASNHRKSIGKNHRKIIARFLQKMNAAQEISKSLRDWMRVNAYVCIFMSILFIMNTAVIIYLPHQQLETLLQPSIDIMGNMANGISIERLIHYMKNFSIFMLIMCILLLVHIFLNFRLQRSYTTIAE